MEPENANTKEKVSNTNWETEKGLEAASFALGLKRTATSKKKVEEE